MRVLARTLVRSVVSARARRWLAHCWLVRRVRLDLRNRLVIGPALDRQLAWQGKPTRAPLSGQRILIPLLQTSHYQYYQLLAIGKALQLRGAEVRVLLCDSVLDGCELKNSRQQISDPCLCCRVNARELVVRYGLETVRLSELSSDADRTRLRAQAADLAERFPALHEHLGVDVIGMTNDSVTRYYYGAQPAAGSPELQRQRERHLYSALIGVEAAVRLHRGWQPTAVVNDMGVYTDWAPYAQYFKRAGVPYHIVSMSPFDPRALMLGYEDFYVGTARFDRWRATRAAPYLEPAEQAELDRFLKTRFAGDSEIERLHGFFSAGAAEFAAGVDRSKRNVFLFSNLYWDIGLNYDDTLYRDVLEWVLDSVAMLADQPDTHLYVKPHPAEVYGSASSGMGVVDAICARWPVLPANVSFIAPELRIKTYELFPLIDLGVVYNGTIGLEMLLKGIPVVTAGAAPYGGTGLSSEPRSREEYSRVLRGELPTPRPAQCDVDLYAYFYFIKAQLPWRLTERVYADDFRGYTFASLDDLLPGRDRHLDHLCDCILHPDRTVVEAWN